MSLFLVSKNDINFGVEPRTRTVQIECLLVASPLLPDTAVDDEGFIKRVSPSNTLAQLGLLLHAATC